MAREYGTHELCFETTFHNIAGGWIIAWHARDIDHASGANGVAVVCYGLWSPGCDQGVDWHNGLGC